MNRRAAHLSLVVVFSIASAIKGEAMTTNDLSALSISPSFVHRSPSAEADRSDDSSIRRHELTHSLADGISSLYIHIQMAVEFKQRREKNILAPRRGNERDNGEHRSDSSSHWNSERRWIEWSNDAFSCWEKISVGFLVHHFRSPSNCTSGSTQRIVSVKPMMKKSYRWKAPPNCSRHSIE